MATITRTTAGSRTQIGIRTFAAVALFIALIWAPAGFAQTTNNQLNLFTNFFVTGDYVVGGVGLRGLGVNGYAAGTISIPDANSVPSTGVPAGANIVGAFLYWETVEGSSSTFAGQTGFFNGKQIGRAHV